jgi:lysine 2,3-aminomutase
MSAYTDRPVKTNPRSRVEWSNWKSHMANSIRTLEQLREWIEVAPGEEEAIRASAGRYRWSITPYYASLMDPCDENCPIRKQCVPGLLETQNFPGSDVDPVGDIQNRKTNRIIHKYPDRIAMLISDSCPVYCRHCTRKYHTTDVTGTYFGNDGDRSFERDFEYIREHPEIRDVLLTGGDPLFLADRRLELILSGIRQIKHVEIIRIGSRYPVLLPQRITPELCQVLDKYHPIFFNTHFNHPKEITPEAAEACDRLVRHGMPVLNQSVLLKGINDDLDTMRALVTGLVKIRVRPYYLYHCDNVTGVTHFATSIQEGREIMRGLIGHTTGFAVPQYVLTTKLGKIPLSEDYVTLGDNRITLTNYAGRKITIANYGTTGED